MNALLGAFNGAPKAITFLLLPEGQPVRQRELSGLFLSAVAETPLAEFNPLVTWRYIDITLQPAGLVAETVYPGAGRNALNDTLFRRTEAGERYGVPAAALILDFEWRHEVSLRKILGKTASPSQDQIRAPYVRSEILLMLDGLTDPVRRQDIIARLGFTPSIVTGALEHLARNGLIEYAAVSRTVPGIVAYEVVPGTDVRGSRRSRPAIDEIGQICRQLAFGGSFTADMVEQRLSPEFLTRWKSDHALKNFIKKTLSRFTREGFLRRQEFKGGEKYSDALIMPRGRTVVRELLLPLRALVRDDPAADSIRSQIVPRVRQRFRDYARNSAELYYPHSTSRRIAEGATDFAAIMAMIRKGNGVSVRDISLALGLERSTVINHIRVMQQAYALADETRGVTKYYLFGRQLAERLATGSFPAPIRRIIADIDRQAIGMDYKVVLLVYATWATNGSVTKTAELLKIRESQVRDILQRLEHDETLIDIYDRVVADETE